MFYVHRVRSIFRSGRGRYPLAILPLPQAMGANGVVRFCVKGPGQLKQNGDVETLGNEACRHPTCWCEQA